MIQSKMDRRGYRLSYHARRRLQQRAVKSCALEAVMDYGRQVYTRGAVIYAIGRQEIEYWSQYAIDLAPYNGLQAVCSHDGCIITIYRNRSFKKLRSGEGCKSFNRVIPVVTPRDDTSIQI